MLLTLLIVVLSAYIRLADVGIGCGEWPQCYALLGLDDEARGISVLTSQGKDIQYRGARVAHRYIASTLGVLIIVLVIASLRQGYSRPTGVLIPLATLAVTTFLSLLGYYTPNRDLPLVTIGNLFGGFGLLGLLWWLMQRYSDPLPTGGNKDLRSVAAIAAIFVVSQIFFGGWSSANFASTSCKDLLSCDQQWLDSSNYIRAYTLDRQLSINDTGRIEMGDELATLTMTHRVFALVTAAYLVWMSRKLRSRASLRSTATAISVFSIGLLAAGIGAVWFELPLWLLSVHNVLAAGLLLSIINLWHRLTPPRSVSQPPG
ncbi:MAG: cytochrome c oxidase assembly protein subunit 15 [Halieaceae bacterium]